MSCLKRILVVLTACGGLSFCTPAEPPAPPPAPPPPLLHTVKYTGETYGVIAAWYTGKVDNWKVIASANPSIKLNRIRIGDQISIPSELVMKQEPLTEKFTAKFAARSVPKPPVLVPAAVPVTGGTEESAVSSFANRDPLEQPTAPVQAPDVSERNAASAVTAAQGDVAASPPLGEHPRENVDSRNKLLEELQR